MKRILHVITTMDRGGAENQLLTLTKAQVESGDIVSVVSLKGENELLDDFLENGISVDAKLTNRNIAVQILLLVVRIVHFKPDIVHAHLPRAELITALTSMFCPIVVSRHNSEKFFPKAPSSISRALSRVVCMCAKRVIFISHGVKTFSLLEREVIHSNKNTVVYYGVEQKQSLEREPTARSHKDKAPKFITIGRLVPQKDILTQLKALSMLSDQSSELIIIGEGELRPKLELYVETYNLNKRVSFLGRTDLVQERIKEADCLILSSRYEGFGLVLLEAVSSGIPIIASAIPTTKEILGEDFPNFFEPGDERRLAQHMQEFICYRKFDFSRYEKILNRFSIEKSRVGIDMVYSQVLGEE